MNKPLSEWTLGEIKSECKRCNGNCINAVCPMVKWISKDEMACVIIRELRKPTPASWDLSEPPRWTEQDKEDANAVRRLFPETEKITKYADGDIKLSFSDGTWLEFYGQNSFPSAEFGEAYLIKEITW